MRTRQIRIAQSKLWGGWQGVEDESGPVRQYIDLLSAQEWANRYCVGAAVAGGLCCAVVIDRGEKESILDEEKRLVMDERGMPSFRWLSRQVVALAHGEWTPWEFAVHLRHVCLYWTSACLCVVANQQGLAVIGELLKLPGRESMQLYLRGGPAAATAVVYRDMYGYALTTDTRESFWAAFSKWIEADPPLLAPPSIMDSAMMVVRSETGSLPTDVSPQTIRACSVTAAIHASMQAQEADRAPCQSVPTGADYTALPRDNKPNGDGAWWAYSRGVG